MQGTFLKISPSPECTLLGIGVSDLTSEHKSKRAILHAVISEVIRFDFECLNIYRQ